MLAINNIEVVYDGVILVLKGVSIEVREGAITTLLGANGAGKTTTLEGDLRRAAQRARRGHQGHRPARRPADRRHARRTTSPGSALVQVFEGRRVFEHLTTEENLVAGGHVARTAPR